VVPALHSLGHSKEEIEQIFAKVLATGKSNKVATNETVANATTLAARDEVPDAHTFGHSKEEIEQMFAKVMGLSQDNKFITNATTANVNKTAEA
jgi:Holliday junction resolvasome RuvABC DNA-binding subunit